MNIDLSNKRALICGASQGIGAATAIELASLGASVTLLARSADRLEQLVNQIKSTRSANADYIAVDIGDHDQLSKAVLENSKKNGHYSILINNSSGPKSGLLSTVQSPEFERAFHNHVIANQLLVRLILPGMQDNQYGRIVNVISTSVKQPIPNLGASNVIRGAVASWAKTLSREVGSDVTVNNILPGFTDTPRLHALAEANAEKTNRDKEAVFSEWVSTIPAQRFAKPEETAAAIAFLCSPAAAYINGINLPVDGGRLMNL